MTSFNLLFFVLFCVVAYLIATEENVAEYVNLKFALLWVNIRRYYYMAIMHPKNPITNWIMERKMKKLARELHEELVKNQEDK